MVLLLVCRTLDWRARRSVGGVGSLSILRSELASGMAERRAIVIWGLGIA